MVSRGELLNRMPEQIAAGRSNLLEKGWLSLMPPDFQEALLEIGSWRSADIGEEFIHAGDTHGGLVGIASGTIEVAVESGHPDARFMHLAHSGFWAGHRPLIGKPRNVAFVARTRSLWVLIPQLAVGRLLREQPHYWRHIVSLSDMVCELAMQIMVDLTRQNGISRAAATLLRLAGCRTRNPGPADDVEIRVPQADIADLAVMSRNTLGTYLAELAKRGLIEVNYRSIRIRNAVGLRALLDSEE